MAGRRAITYSPINVGAGVQMGMAGLLKEILGRPRPEGITLAQMDRFLPVIRKLSQAEDDKSTLILEQEEYDLCVSELTAFTFARVDHEIRDACRAFIELQPIPTLHRTNGTI